MKTETDRVVRTWCEALAHSRGAGIRIIGRTTDEECAGRLAALARAAEGEGYLLVDAHRDLPDEVRRRLWHRHLVVVHRGAPSLVSTRWIRELSMASPRAHAVLVVAGLPDRVSEAAVHPPWQAPWQASWRRRSSTERHCSARVLRHGRRQLAVRQSLSIRAQVVAEMADAWLTEGALEAAAAALAGVDVECQLKGLSVSPGIRERQAEVVCWQGEWDAAARFADDARHTGWRAVVACARRDWDSVRAIVAERVPAPAEWAALLVGLGAAAAGDAPGVRSAVERMDRGVGPARWRDALALECLRMVDAETEAERWRRRWDRRPRGAAESVLWRYVTHPPGRTAAGIETEVERLGAAGIRRWGLRRSNMQMWAGVSSLLQLVQEADDAANALLCACRWAREYTGVDAVGLVAGSGQILACDPEAQRRALASPERTAIDDEPVRYGGARIGAVVLLGSPRDAAEARAVAAAVATACAPAVRSRLDELQVARAGDALAGELLGASPGMTTLRDAVARAAASAFPVLIEGESGTGKELVARAVHRLSPRRDRRWAVVNCAALTDELLEAELFGHTRGAFTGAIGARTGLLEDAHEGTMFLDEVAELSPRGQAKLLRVLQEGEIRRVGENQSRRIDVRLVTATNRSLEAGVRQGTYREDLVFRLAVIRLRVPPLRDRIEDVPLLAYAFWQTASARVASRALLTPDAVAALCRYHWPGNVRELQNVIAALAVAAPARGRVCGRQVGQVLAERGGAEGGQAPVSLAVARRLCDARTVTAALARHAGQRAAAARELGVSRQGLSKLIARLSAGPTGPTGPTGPDV